MLENRVHTLVVELEIKNFAVFEVRQQIGDHRLLVHHAATGLSRCVLISGKLPHWCSVRGTCRISTGPRAIIAGTSGGAVVIGGFI